MQLNSTVRHDTLGNSQTFIRSHDTWMEGQRLATGPPCHKPLGQ